MDPAYLCFMLLGMGFLFPWSALLTAADYWESRYPGRHTDRLLTACYLPANLAVVAAMVALHGRLRPRVRVVGGLLGFTAAMAAVVAMDYAAPTPRSLAVVLALMVACGCCDGLVSGALFGEAASLAPRYSQAVMAGTAASGVVVSLLRMTTKALLPGTPEGLSLSASIFFGCAAAVCLLCALLYACVLPRLSAVREQRAAALDAALLECEMEWQQIEGEGPAVGSLGPPHGALLPTTTKTTIQVDATAAAGAHLKGEGQIQLCSPLRPPGSLKAWYPWQYQQQQQQQQQQYQQQGDEEGGSLQQPLLLPAEQWFTPRSSPGGSFCCSPSRGSSLAGSGSGCGSRLPSSGAVLCSIWKLAAANTLLFTVTLSIFPGVLTEDEHSKRFGSWYPILLIAVFNCGDWVGKALPGYKTLRLSNNGAILLLASLRSLFIPAFRLAAVHHYHPPAVFCLAGALGLTNGYCLACSMMRGPACVAPPAAHLAGNMLVLFMVLGLCCGSACSFLWLLFPLQQHA